MKRTALAFCLFVVLVFFIFIFGYLQLPLIRKDANNCILVSPNETFTELSLNLQEKIPHLSLPIVKLYAKLTRLDRHLSPGEYCFSRDESILTLLKKINRGQRRLHKFVLFSGWAYKDIVTHLKQAPGLSYREILDDISTLSEALGIDKQHVEGAFYPDTYYYAYPDTPLDILRKAHKKMQNKLDFFYDEVKDVTFFQSKDELLIAASIIEKESGIPEDQRLVAGVLVNRLKLKMKLQMDPTVIYGLGSQRHDALTKHDLQSNSLYNTYRYYGLPPTAICMPGESALYAAAHPSQTSFLYYVSKNNGYLVFSTNLIEHNKAVQRYIFHEERE